jgi:hypothetical protein
MGTIIEFPKRCRRVVRVVRDDDWLVIAGVHAWPFATLDGAIAEALARARDDHAVIVIETVS